MREHEFYADPTLFDQWQRIASDWLCEKNDKCCPYGWALGFALLGTALVLVSLTALGFSLHSAATQLAPAWNESLARGVTAVTALAAAQALFRQALDAWPQDTRLPAQLLKAGRYVGWQPVRPVRAANSAVTKPVEKRSQPGPDGEALQRFFAGVRAAGVNVAIAKALFTAGIRSPQQLMAASDRRLVAIRGVGPATVRKLRAQFG
ncbi:MAG: helix-hairpin-helix domain-containing protein [Thiogranum sp.]|jgi:hypothetical protein